MMHLSIDTYFIITSNVKKHYVKWFTSNGEHYGVRRGNMYKAYIFILTRQPGSLILKTKN